MTQLQALLLTLAIEAPVAALIVAGFRWGSPWRAGAAAAIGTLATHWAVWLVLPELWPLMPDGLSLLLVEGAVVLLETVGYRGVDGLPWRRALLVSLVANAASTGVGLAIQALT